MKKLANVFLTITAGVFMTFLIIKIMPGDPVTILANELRSTQGISEADAMSRAISMLNYDPSQPLLQQISHFILQLLRGNLGTSIRFRTPVLSIVFSALPWTLFSAGVATILSYMVGTRIGLMIAWSKNKRLNMVTETLTSMVGSFPDYIIGFFLVSLFAVQLVWLPSRGAYGSQVTVGLNLPFLISVGRHGILPISAIFVVYLANWILNMRGSAMNVMHQEYIKYARARGLSDGVIRKKYVGKNARLPMITTLGTTFGLLLGGAPLIENIFSYPGLGYYLNTAIAVRDIPLMQGMFFMIIVTVVGANVIVDTLYGYLDPRLRRQSE
ncbi:ABC transporter permease [Enterococcus sp.]|uniref:ABC transporter permease n=1 Tax=Enterococcus sp. TaxID=35783 RepID=UPI0025C3144E|nr:ABC transporter permease [Enterococcus sp.]